jgi:hypothetical protein
LMICHDGGGGLASAEPAVATASAVATPTDNAPNPIVFFGFMCVLLLFARSWRTT